jgi:hypothetical protein
MALVMALTHWAVLALVTAAVTRLCHSPLVVLPEQLRLAASGC